MGYNLLAIQSKEPDWIKLHNEILDREGAIELFPINENDGKYYLGINIPLYKLRNNKNTASDLEQMIKILKEKYGFEIFDLYNGFFVDDSNMDKVIESLTA